MIKLSTLILLFVFWGFHQANVQCRTSCNLSKASASPTATQGLGTSAYEFQTPTIVS